MTLVGKNKDWKWFEYHDFRENGNIDAKCSKCGKVEVYSGGWDKVRLTKCRIKTTTDLKKLLKTRNWRGSPPNSYFEIKPQPYHYLDVHLREVL